MKIILVVLSLWTVQAHAEVGLSFQAKFLSCESGDPLQKVAVDLSQTTYEINGDKTQLTVHTANGQDKVYSLNVADENGTSFMTTPAFEDATEADYFFVSTKQLPQSLEISTRDWMGENCGGGLVQTSAVSSAVQTASVD